ELIAWLRVSDYWPVEVPGVRRVVNDATERYRAKAATPRKPSWAMPLPPMPGVVDEVYTAPDGSRYVVCPWCMGYNVPVPPGPAAMVTTVTLKCPGCRKRFAVVPRGARPMPVPVHPLPVLPFTGLL